MLATLILFGSAQAADPAREVRIGLPRLPAAWDPALATRGPELMVLREAFEGLVEFGDRGDIEPALATQWSVSRDGLTWTFRLRPDVQFHNGVPLTPDVVVASLARHLAPDEAALRGDPDRAQTWRGAASLVREIRRGQPGTVQVVLAQAFSPLLALLAHPAFAIALPQSDPDVPFSGTGPFRVAQRTPRRVVLEAAPVSRGEPSRPTRLIVDEIGEDALGLAALGPYGALHVYFPQAPPAWGGLGLQVLSAPTWRVGLLALRSQDGLLARKPVRQAVAAALDPALMAPAVGRTARLLKSYLPPGAWAARDAGLPAYDPTRARRLLAEAQAGGASLTLLARDAADGPDGAALQDAVRLSLAVAGLKVEVRREADEAYLAALRQGEGDLALLEAALEVNDPHFFFRPLLAWDAAGTGSTTNLAFFRSPVADSLLSRASQIGFRPERLRLYQRLQAHLAEELPYLPLYVRLQWALARPGVRDFRLDPGGRHRLERIWVEPPPEAAPPPVPTLSPPPALPVPGLGPAVPAAPSQ